LVFYQLSIVGVLPTDWNNPTLPAMTEDNQPSADQQLPGDATAPLVKLLPSPFRPDEVELQPLRHQAIGNARGKIVKRVTGWQGLVEIDGFRYEYQDERRKVYKAKYPLSKYMEADITFSFWPTFDAGALARREPDDPPLLKIASLRKELVAPNLVEVIGLVEAMGDEHVTVAIHSSFAKTTFYTTLLGHHDGQVGDLVQVFGRLEGGIIRLERSQRLEAIAWTS
jgi:hypothetical protein